MKPGHILIFCVVVGMFSCNKDETEPPVVIPAPRVAVTDIAIPEGDQQDEVIIPVNIIGQREMEVKLYYETRDGTAEAQRDYVPVWGELVFPPGPNDTTYLLPITIYGNVLTEDEEYFELHLTDIENAIPEDTSMRITLLNDDEPHPEYPGYETPLEYEGMELVWHDEFDIIFLESNWQFALGDGCPNICGWGNNQLQYYRAENTAVEDGLLTITAKEETYAGYAYTSSRLLSQDRFEFRYGRVDIRARLPEGKGIWPALWMLGANRNEIGWPECGEVDIMELRGSDPTRVCGTLHYQNQFGNHQNTGAECFSYLSKKFSDEFHVFTIVWNEEGIKWYINDLKFHEEKFGDLNLGSDPNPFQKEFYFLLNVAVGGNYDGDPDQSTVFPQKMDIDYIRVFQDQ